jgi:acetylornithine deacetylase/succinyl-diaminopimelate desuccinylase-like protein
MVPQVCRITIDRGLLPEESPAAAEGELREVSGSFSSQVEDVSCELRPFAQSWPALNSDPESALIQVMQGLIRDVAGHKRTITGYSQRSNGRFFAARGIPVVFGPSDPAVGHAPNEHVAQFEDSWRRRTSMR